MAPAAHGGMYTPPKTGKTGKVGKPMGGDTPHVFLKSRDFDGWMPQPARQPANTVAEHDCLSAVSSETRSAHTVSHYIMDVTIQGGALRAPPLYG